ncbi:hypothetical protein ACOMHN_014991 [Nucella lapillus]
MLVAAQLISGVLVIVVAVSPSNAATIISNLELLKTQLNNQIEDLTDELGDTRASLQSTISELKATKADLADTKQDVKNLQKELQDIRENLNSILDHISQKRFGSTFIRWGREKCPVLDINPTSLVYSGIVGGKHYTHKGSGTNALCLTKEPMYDDKTKPSTNGFVYGSEYEGTPDLQDQEIPCSVCRTTYADTIMIPGTNACPKGWSLQYSGHLASGYYSHYASQFVCLDREPEGMTSSRTNSNGFLLYIVASKCGSLPCPPYINDKVLTCVVCSK